MIFNIRKNSKNINLADVTMKDYYTKMLLNGIQSYQNLSVEDIPLIINTVDTSYPLAFIDYEEDDVLGVNYTAEDGTERFIIINKKYIVDIAILYKDDIDIIVKSDDKTEDSDVMYQ